MGFAGEMERKIETGGLQVVPTNHITEEWSKYDGATFRKCVSCIPSEVWWLKV